MTTSAPLAPQLRVSRHRKLGAALVLALALACAGGQEVAAAGPPRPAKARHQAKPRGVAKAAPRARAPRAIKRTGLRAGWTLPICYAPADRRRAIHCTDVATISRQSPEIALRLAEAVNRAAEARRGTRKPGLSADGVLADLLRDPTLLGCAGKGRHQGAVYLAAKGAALRSKRGKRGKRGIDKSITSACADSGAGGSDGIAIGTAVAEWYAATEADRTFYNDWLRDNSQCEAGSGGGGSATGNTMMQGGSDDGGGGSTGSTGARDASGTPSGTNPVAKPPTLKRFAGKLWEVVSSKLVSSKQWKQDTKNGATGGRGYCFADDDCASTCHGNAMARSLAKELQRSGYDGCNDDVTPAPGSTNTCYNVLNKNKLTESMRRQLWTEACAAKGGVQQACDDPSVCSVRCATPDELEKGERSWQACADPRAMCGPDQVGGWPGADPPKPDPGPAPFPEGRG